MSRHGFFAHAELIKEGLGNTKKIETPDGTDADLRNSADIFARGLI